MKNIVLIVEGSEAPIMIFGKVTEDYYHLDLRHPLSPMQAFAIAIANFSYSV